MELWIAFMSSVVRRKRWTFIAFVLLSGAILGSIAYFYVDYLKQEKIRLEKAEQAAAHEKAFAKEFEDLLNKFLHDFRNATREYKAQRAVLRELASPYNFESPEYAAETYTLFQNEIAPSLRASSKEAIAIFDNTSKQIELSLSKENESVHLKLSKVWNEVKDKNIKVTIRFFQTEDKLLTAYENLFKFYYTRSKFFTLNKETGDIVFKRKKDELGYKKLLAMIEKIKNDQKEMLQEDLVDQKL